MDKQIIIDGVDVADCEHINACDKKMKCVILQDDVCETNPYCEGFNCYYKQLKRKEQECVQLKADNEHLSEKEKEARHYLEEAYKFKQALTEIKQLLEDALDTDKTNAEQSFDCLYEALEKCEVLDE